VSRQFYRLRDYYPGDRPLHAPNPRFMAVKTGEFRAVRAGEWYLSGAIPEAYRAQADLAESRDILRVVEVETVTTIVVKEKR
jgi:hypothetical protein